MDVDVARIWSFVRTAGRPRYYLALLLISNVCASASWGIITPTIIANCLARGSSTLVIGILTSIWALPFLIAAPIYTRIVGRVSAKPALLVGMSADVVCVWLFPLVPYDWAWIILQIVSGATLGHFSLITEAWLAHLSYRLDRGSRTETKRIAGHERRSTSVHGIHGAPGPFTGIMGRRVPVRRHRHGDLYIGPGNSRTAISSATLHPRSFEQRRPA